MASKAPQIGDNYGMTAANKERIASLTREIIKLENERSSINDDISAARSEIKAFGVNMDAWRASKRRQAMDPDQREEFDRSQAICNEALGVPIQSDLFEAPETSTEIPAGLH